MSSSVPPDQLADDVPPLVSSLLQLARVNTTPTGSGATGGVGSGPGSGQAGKSAFDWDVYKNRRTALQYLKRNCTLVDTILETEDGLVYEFVHSQVISAFGEKLTNYIQQNGQYVDSYRSMVFQGGGSDVARSYDGTSGGGTNGGQNRSRQPVASQWSSRWPGKMKLIRVPLLNKYTLAILVECAYTGYIRTDLHSGGVWQVLGFAHHYEMIEVIRACCAYLTKNLDRSNCVHFYHIGGKYRNALQRCAWHKIRANFKHILAQNLRRANLEPEMMELTFFTEASRAAAAPTPMPIDYSNNNDHDDDQHPNVLGAQAGVCSELEREWSEELEWKNNNLATISYEHFEGLLMHDKLNVDNEESVWCAIRLWCNYNLIERGAKVAGLLPCMRFPRFRTGTEFSAQNIWRDPLVQNNQEAQQQLAVLDRQHRELLAGTTGVSFSRDGFSLPCATHPRQLRPRVPHSILLAIGGWQQGQPTRLIESYDSNCNLWFDCKKRITLPLAYHGIECINGLLYICGGTDGSEILNEVFTFDPVRGDCAQRTSMRESRCYVSTAYLGGYLYAMGGHNGFQRMKSVERFEVEADSWNHVQDMNVARSDASACVYESLIYIAGGLNDQVIESSVEFYNPSDNTWTFAASMITPRTSFTLILFHDSLLAIGGNNGSERLASVEQYSFVTKLWSHHSSMRHRRSTFSAALIDDSKLVVVGGYNGQTPFNQVEMYDEETRGWVTLQKIRYDRSGHKVVVVSDLPNATDYTFQGAGGGGGSSASNSDAEGGGGNRGLAAIEQAPTPAAAPLAPSLTARARQRFLRSIGAIRHHRPRPAASPPSDDEPNNEQAAEQRQRQQRQRRPS